MNWASAGRKCASILAPAVMSLTVPLESLAAEESTKGTLSLVLENNFFYNCDNNYTNGIRVAWLSAPSASPCNSESCFRSKWGPDSNAKQKTNPAEKQSGIGIYFA